MSRLALFSLSALTVAGLAGSMAVPAAADPAVPTLRLVGQQTSVSQLDLGPAGGSAGDEVVFSGSLRDAQQRPAGRFNGVLIALDAEGNRNQAQVTLVLPAGQIAVQGELDFAGPQPFVHAVTGGTGRYAGAGGTFAFRRTDQPGVIEITVDLR